MPEMFVNARPGVRRRYFEVLRPKPRAQCWRPSPQQRRKIFERDGNQCVWCGATAELQLDHVIPICKGGSDLDVDNFQTLCRDCNALKRGALIDA
jgi:5-methylcytosine-specific restriction endonuclease McrA